VGIVVRLTQVDARLLTPLLSVAVAETRPEEVMPPVEAPPGWSQPRRDAFCEFYRSHYRGLNGPTRTLTYGILCNGDVVGMIRMARSDGPDTLETGMWLGRSVRGRGIGVKALRLLLDEAARAGARRVLAETTAENAAAIKVLRRCSAVLVFDGSQVHAEIPVRPAGGEHVSKPDGY
jgi:RimJ/RimL family protein N-acetyltransferase